MTRRQICGLQKGRFDDWFANLKPKQKEGQYKRSVDLLKDDLLIAIIDMTINDRVEHAACVEERDENYWIVRGEISGLSFVKEKLEHLAGLASKKPEEIDNPYDVV